MKKNDYERIESQLSPDEELMRSVMDKAESFSAEPEMAQAYLQEHDISERPAIKHTGRFAIVAAAAALVIAFGVVAFVRQGDESIKTDPSAVSKAESRNESDPEAQSKAYSTSSVAETTSISEKESTDPTETSAQTAEISQAGKQTTHKPETEPEQHDETADDGRADWFPDAGYDYPVTAEEGEGYQQAGVLALPTGEYRDIELNGTDYHFACGDYGEIWEFYIGSNNIPNSSYIGDFITTVDAASIYGDIRPNTTAEIYSLKYAPSDFMIAVKFPYFNNDQRYYLFANYDKTYDGFVDLMTVLNMDKYTFNGQAINVYNGTTKYIDGDSEIAQLILSADGVPANTAYGEAQWKTYLDTPMYGASVNFTCYSGGYIAVNYFGSKVVYNVGTDVTDSITNYINENSHE
ncbi:MAG: hypothetical protein IJ571_04725 [Ruminococcus sp.]|nr:hypothetical protein [Ruminococcus sp.]